MEIDEYGNVGYTERDLITILAKDPKANVDGCFLIGESLYNKAIELNFSDLTPYPSWNDIDRTAPITEFHNRLANTWLFPEEYKNFDIAKYLLDCCNSPEELQRMGEELLLFASKDLLPFLCYLKYMVDTLKKNNILLGVGRGSSVASFALYKLGVHKINSLKFDINIREFLKE